jgi:hypothetical protein
VEADEEDEKMADEEEEVEEEEEVDEVEEEEKKEVEEEKHLKQLGHHPGQRDGETSFMFTSFISSSKFSFVRPI